MMKIRMLLVCVSILFASCAGAGNVTGERRNVNSITATFTATPSKARPGQPVRLTIRLLNNAALEQQLVYNTGQRYDFWVTSGGREVWRWSAGQMFTQEVTKQKLQGQTGVSYSESWTAGAIGTYLAHGEIHANGYKGDMKAQVVVG
jgi:hypothetical protein